ncbi:MAG TPA: alkaline phosphatase D family protein [Cryptosporangiaceae bacterium]|nr:alkaline phosphatase D family protein [Cryptosporangiaceae bacterium]
MAELVLGPLLRHVGDTWVTVWVETDAPCEVDVLGRTSRTFTVHGHHYALVVVDGLRPGTVSPYQVRLDGNVTWPVPDSDYPPSILRTLDPATPRHLIFGSCRHSTAEQMGRSLGYHPDALDTYARRMIRTDPTEWPDAVLLLGDQVYADNTSSRTQEFIKSRRPVDEPPYLEVADFAEYAALYQESWTDPDIRWLFANLPSAMIFDDHDIRDDWNTSYAWRQEMEQEPWWRRRILGGLASYWVYQHLGNLSPGELAADLLYQQVRRSDDGGVVLERLAARSDHKVDGGHGTGVRWNFRLDYGRVRLLFVDTRCGRVLTPDERSMMSDAEFDWLTEQVHGDYDHLLVASSLPWLLPWAIHDLESGNEALCAGSRGPRIAWLSEKMRRGADLEHWSAFAKSFERLGQLLASVARGERGGQPASVCVLSGDVHHAYVARASFTPPTVAPIYQIVVSPVHHGIPLVMKLAFTVGWSRLARRMARPFARWARAPHASPRWTRLSGPYYGNELGTLVLDGRIARFHLERAEPRPEGTAQLISVTQVPLTWRDEPAREPQPELPARAELG